jgi:hypothetical protein
MLTKKQREFALVFQKLVLYGEISDKEWRTLWDKGKDTGMDFESFKKKILSEMPGYRAYIDRLEVSPEQEEDMMIWALRNDLPF